MSVTAMQSLVLPTFFRASPLKHL